MGFSTLGAGFIIKARDAASPVFGGVRKSFGRMISSVRAQSKSLSATLGGMAVGYGMFRLGKGMVGTVTGMADAAGIFEQKLAAVGAVAKALPHEMKELHDSAIDAAIATQFSPTDAVEGLTNLATAGLTVRESTTALIPVLDLAAGSLGQLGLGEAAMAVVGTLKAFGYETDRAGEVTDKLLRITQLTNFQARDFEAGLARAASTAKLFGQNIDDTLITMGLLRNMNLDASVASTSLREAWRRLASDERSQQIIRAKGVKIFRSQDGKIRDMLGIMLELEKKTTKLTDKERMRISAQAFGTRGMAAFNAVAQAQRTVMIDNIPITLKGAAAVESLRMEMDKSAGAAEEFKNKLLETYQGQKTLIGGTLSAIQVMLGEGAVELFTPMAKGIYKFLTAFAGFIKAMSPETKKKIMGVVATLGAFVAGVGGLILVGNTMGMLGMSVVGLAVSMAKLVLLGGPALVLLSGLAVGVYAVYRAFKKNVGGITGSWEEMVTKVRLGVQGMAELFSSGEISKELGDELDKLGNQGVLLFLERFDRFRLRMKEFWSGLKTGFNEGVAALAPRIEQLREKFSGVFDLFSSDDNTASVLDSWRIKGESAGKTLATLGDTALELAGRFMSAGQSASKALSELTADDFKKGVRDVVGFFHDLKAVVGAVATMIKYVVQAFKGLMILGGRIGDVVHTVTDTRDAVGSLFGSLVTFDKQGVKDAAHRIQSNIGGFEFTDVQEMKRKVAGEFLNKDELAAEYRHRAGSMLSRRYRVHDGVREETSERSTALQENRQLLADLTKATNGKSPAIEGLKKVIVAQEKQFSILVEYLKKSNRDDPQAIISALRQLNFIVNLDGEKVGQGLKRAQSDDEARDAASVIDDSMLEAGGY